MGSLQTVMHNALVVLASTGFDAKSALKAVHDERYIISEISFASVSVVIIIIVNFIIKSLYNTLTIAIIDGHIV